MNIKPLTFEDKREKTKQVEDKLQEIKNGCFSSGQITTVKFAMDIMHELTILCEAFNLDFDDAVKIYSLAQENRRQYNG